MEQEERAAQDAYIQQAETDREGKRWIMGEGKLSEALMDIWQAGTMHTPYRALGNKGRVRLAAGLKNNRQV